MTDLSFTRQLAIWLAALGVAFLLIYWFLSSAKAEPAKPESPSVFVATTCPTPAPCKIIIITDDMEKSLTGPNMVFDQAEWAARSSLAGIIGSWRRVLQEAPRGTPPEQLK